MKFNKFTRRRSRRSAARRWWNAPHDGIPCPACYNVFGTPEYEAARRAEMERAERERAERERAAVPVEVEEAQTND